MGIAYTVPTASQVEMPVKPENIEKFLKAKDKYSRMAIFFDENFYSENRDDTTCYNYMRNIYGMLASKKKYFSNYDDYTGYAYFSANIIYMRFLKKLKKGERIISVLNYIKSTLYPLKIMYQNQAFNCVTKRDDDTDCNHLNANIRDSLRESVQDSYSSLANNEILNVFKNVSKYVDTVLKKELPLPLVNDKSLMHKMRISCLISLCGHFTLSNENKKRLKNIENTKGYVDITTYLRAIKDETYTNISRWRLDYGQSCEYIEIIINEIKQLMMKDISEIKEHYKLSESTIDDILASAWENKSSTTSYEDVS